MFNISVSIEISNIMQRIGRHTSRTHKGDSTISHVSEDTAFIIGECQLDGFECQSTIVHNFSSAYYWWTATNTANPFDKELHISLIRPNGSYYGGHHASLGSWNNEPIMQRPALQI